MKLKSIYTALGRQGKVAAVSAILLMMSIFSGCSPTPGPDEEKGPIDPVAEIVKETAPSVVNIEANGAGKGSGIIFSEDGYILTNDHVIRGANSLEVHLSDKRTLTAKLIGTDPRRDVAVIKVEGENLTAAKLADSSKVKVGSEVLVIGNAKGIENSVTKGVISNLNIDVDTGMDIRRCLQTDAPINPGNSGGALVNMQGEIIGVNDMKRNDAESIGFAIPINDAKEIADQLIEKGYVSLPYLGVDAVNQTTDDGTPFILVRNVMPDSPAAKVGLKVKDVIVQVNDARVETVSKLREQLYVSGIESIVSIHIVRVSNKGGQEGIIQVKLEELPKGYYSIDWT